MLSLTNALTKRFFILLELATKHQQQI